MRIGGLASGIDMDGIVEQLMAIEQRPLLQMQRKQQELEYQKHAWRDVNTRMKSLADKFSVLKLDATYVSRLAKASNGTILIAKASPEAVEGIYQVHVTQLATAAASYSDQRVENVDAALGAGTLTLTADNGNTELATVEIGEDWSLRDLVQHINELQVGEGDEAQPLSIRASIVDNRLVLTSKETGADHSFNVELTGTLLEGGFTPVTGGGQDAKLEINGIAIEAASNTLKDVIQGVTLDLTEVGQTTVTVSQDTKQVVNKLQEFVNQYNSTIDFINDKLQAKTEGDSSSARGTLSGDTTLMRLQSNLRSMVAGSVVGADGKSYSLADIGIGTAKFVAGAADYSGKLSLDTAKLEEALKDDPLAVKDILFRVSKEMDGGEEVTKNYGIFNDLEAYIRNFTRAGDGILTGKDRLYERQLKDLQGQVEKMEYRLELRQERLVSQFVALERALGTMQSQGNWLEAQLGQLNNMYRPQTNNK